MATFAIRYEGKLEAQGGGHGRICQCQVVYPAISKPLDHQEGAAYNVLLATPLASSIPKFYGIFDGSIIIEDLTAGFQSPCMADLKVGTRHYDLHATPEKVRSLVDKQRGSTTDSHGVRLIDGKVRRGGQTVAQWDRKQGLKFSIAELKHVIGEFLPGPLLQEFHQRVQVIAGRLAETTLEAPGFRMYASSILVAYDGDAPDRGLRVKLIDFAHTFGDIAAAGGDPRDRSLDDGVAKGLATLIDLSA
jgi:hypothetical protein